MRATRHSAPFFIAVHDPGYAFPDPALAMDDPNGLLAVGGDLSMRRLLSAYRQGIFPWYSDGQPILWWSPDPRAVLTPDRLKVSRSLRKTLRQGRFTVTCDQAFAEVIGACAGPRAGGPGTWITGEMMQAYTGLHRHGIAHSVEAWEGDELAGGLYGVALGRAFFGESMFHRRRDASKVAFVHLVRHLQRRGYDMIDCQVGSEHLASLGAEEIDRGEFLDMLTRCLDGPAPAGAWPSGPLSPPDA